MVRCPQNFGHIVYIAVMFFLTMNTTKINIVTSGGTKYIVPASIKILRVFPLEEGLIFQCEYNPDAIRFTLGPLDPDSISFAYLSLNGHPLNDLRPLSIMNSGSPNDLICTKVNLL